MKTSRGDFYVRKKVSGEAAPPLDTIYYDK
jgi:hypothetical protein